MNIDKNPHPSDHTEKSWEFETVNELTDKQFDDVWEEGRAYEGKHVKHKYPHISIHDREGSLTAKSGYFYRLYDCTIEELQAEAGSTVYARNCAIVKITGTASGAKATIIIVDSAINSVIDIDNYAISLLGSTTVGIVSSCHNCSFTLIKQDFDAGFTDCSSCSYRYLGGSSHAPILFNKPSDCDAYVAGVSCDSNDIVSDASNGSYDLVECEIQVSGKVFDGEGISCSSIYDEHVSSGGEADVSDSSLNYIRCALRAVSTQIKSTGSGISIIDSSMQSDAKAFQTISTGLTLSKTVINSSDNSIDSTQSGIAVADCDITSGTTAMKAVDSDIRSEGSTYTSGGPSTDLMGSTFRFLKDTLSNTFKTIDSNGRVYDSSCKSVDMADSHLMGSSFSVDQTFVFEGQFLKLLESYIGGMASITGDEVVVDHTEFIGNTNIVAQIAKMSKNSYTSVVISGGILISGGNEGSGGSYTSNLNLIGKDSFSSLSVSGMNVIGGTSANTLSASGITWYEDTVTPLTQPARRGLHVTGDVDLYATGTIFMTAVNDIIEVGRTIHMNP